MNNKSELETDDLMINYNLLNDIDVKNNKIKKLENELENINNIYNDLINDFINYKKLSELKIKNLEEELKICPKKTLDDYIKHYINKL